MPSAVPSFASFPSLSNTATPRPRKRILDGSCSPVAVWTTKRVKLSASAVPAGTLSPVSARAYAIPGKEVVARLMTSDELDVSHGERNMWLWWRLGSARREADFATDIEVVLGHPTTIGRGNHCNYVIKSSVVSNVHFRLYAVTTSEGDMIVSCEPPGSIIQRFALE
ncbi:hypothetical protein FRC11_000185 [Ceratobasidium sp. 423]|nr:hypothetical protein FRC11_000185 [Ceratobasidium sp. 423]